jgi:hypothetical protein
MSTSILNATKLNVAHWRTQLIRSAVPAKSVNMCGSLVTGLSIGPRPLIYSAVTGRESAEKIIEVDVRIILNPGFDPLDLALLRTICDVVGATTLYRGTIQRWGRTIPQSSLYRRAPWARNVSLEWDISINVEPYFETAEWWSLAFSPGEIAAQRQLRLNTVEKSVPRETYEALKSLQSRELRWRLASGLSRPALVPESQPFNILRSMLHTNPILASSVSALLVGELQRPDAGKLLCQLQDHGVTVPELRSPPEWVRLVVESGRTHEPR